ncbi:HD domain-containing protein [Heyndrickxia coagulans]|uniref:HD domain-containing protein n=1 Tax=Heyndrickxia coagulans TaxID=1398 RepID=UPI002E2361EF|nr:HD domain-containing protein [Heyndrickxia coagulans]
MEAYANIISFVKELERLKVNTRTAWTSTGRQESIAEHSWRLSLFAMALQDDFPEMNFNKVLRMSLIHDLGEAYGGDIPATKRTPLKRKLEKEEAALLKLIKPLSASSRQQFVSLWKEYNKGETLEAKLVKALDKIETIIQHNQGKNPRDFDYSFNLQYGKEYAQFHPAVRKIRELVDIETSGKIGETK